MPHKPKPPGIYSNIEVGMEFMVWISKLKAYPTIKDIRSQFSCSRATAYRYLSYYSRTIERLQAARPQLLECGLRFVHSLPERAVE